MSFKKLLNNPNIKELLKPMSKPSIQIAIDKIANCPIGSSKVGGKPDLPTDFKWFYFDVEDDDGTVDKYPLSFLAQINCEDVHQYDKDSLLPTNGMLYFFYEMDTFSWGFDPKNKGSARVYYHPGDVSELHRTDFPPDFPEEYQLPEMPMTFSVKNELPSFDEFFEQYNDDDNYEWEYEDVCKYDDTIAEMGFESVHGDDEKEEAITKLLGYASVIQNSMLLECEKVTNGIYCGEATNIPPDILRQHKENSKQWQLLFQLDSIYLDNREIVMWGDMGRLFYYIKIDDLKNMNFENCWLILQCG